MTRPRISVLYYLKNEEAFAPYSILSVQNVADEIIVVDNGSTDRTRECVKLFDRVRLYEYETDDFSELGNFALSKCSGDWILKLDGDEVFYNDLETVVPLLVEYDAFDAFTCRYFNLMFAWDRMQNVDESDRRFERIFLFRRHSGLHYRNAIHESLHGIGPMRAFSGLHYVHYGYAKPLPVIMQKLRGYARKMGEPYFYEGRTEKDLLAQAERRPFPYRHPEVIRPYIESKGYAGGKPKPPVDREALKVKLDRIAAEAKPAENAKNAPRVLEIGAHPGCITPDAEHMDIRPLDYVDIIGDIRRIPARDDTYDEVIVPGYLMEHLPYKDVVTALSECRRIAKPGGNVRVRIYDGKQIATAYAKGEISNESFNKLLFGDGGKGWENHRSILDNETLRAMLEKAGLEDVALEYYEHWMIQIGGKKPNGKTTHSGDGR